MRISPYLLKMKWDDKPLYHHSSKGWGYLIPADNGRTLDIWNANNVEQWYVCTALLPLYSETSSGGHCSMLMVVVVLVVYSIVVVCV